jgi:histidinol-phosphate aminotransferase
MSMLPFLRSDLAQLHAYTPHGEDPPGLPMDQLDTNENPYDLPIALREKLAWTFQNEIRSNRYPDGGMATLKGAIADYVNQTAVHQTGLNPEMEGQTAVTPAQISLGNGSDELIRSVLIATCLGGRGAILVANPTFSMYGILAQTLGIPVVEVQRTADFALDLTAAQAAMGAPRTVPIRVVFVVHPNSPTGNALTPAEIDWLKSLPEQVLVVIDEAYFEFSQTTLVPELPHRPNWLVMRTFSKAFRLAAHRIGYAIAHADVIAALEKVRLPYNLPSTTQAAALAALAHRQDLMQVIPEILTERSHLYTLLNQYPALHVWPSNANFLYVRLRPEFAVSTGLSLDQLCQDLKAQGTRIRHTGGGLRITIGTPAENARTWSRLQHLLAVSR